MKTALISSPSYTLLNLNYPAECKFGTRVGNIVYLHQYCKRMNHLYIIGNGFDIAHNLNTRYHDFIVWYLGQIWQDVVKNQNTEIHINDPLITIEKDNFIPIFRPLVGGIKDSNNFTDKMEGFVQSTKHHFHYTMSDLLIRILKKDKEGWADIEKEYFELLKSCFKKNDGSILELNKGLISLKTKLIEYIVLVMQGKPTPKDTIISILNSIEKYEKQLFLCFNYTNVLQFYDCIKTKDIINILGSYNSTIDSIIFGYGDEMDEMYKEIEDLDNDEYLINMKSFGYFRSHSYQQLVDFIGQNDYKVHCLGHSLGLSDRLLLNTILKHDNCAKIELHYYHEDSNDNFDELTMKLSRHFDSRIKDKMRNIVVPRPLSKSMD